MATQNKTDIGLIGLAVMGENLALNMESRGWSVSVYNRTVPGVEEGVVERFINGRAKGKHIEGFTDIEAFVESIEEWLWANGIKKMTIDYLHHCLEEKTPVQEAIHERMRQLDRKSVV